MTEATRGILNPRASEQKFFHARVLPLAGLRSSIEHYWIVKWDLRGQQPYVAETLPFPSVHIAIEDGRPEVYGVVTRKFSRLLQGQGRVFGIKFRPATFFMWYGAPLSSLTDQVVGLDCVFGNSGLVLRKNILGASDDSHCVEVANSFLKERIPPSNSKVEKIRDAVERVIEDRSIVRAEQMADLMDVSLRPLQRLFRKYVGVSPKWIIQRYRLHEAAEALAREEIKSMSELAHRLGYFDQAHFVRDFKSVVGVAPGAYLAKESGQEN